MVLNSDSHSPSDLLDKDAARDIAIGAGLEENYIQILEKNANEILERINT